MAASAGTAGGAATVASGVPPPWGLSSAEVEKVHLVLRLLLPLVLAVALDSQCRLALERRSGASAPGTNRVDPGAAYFLALHVVAGRVWSGSAVAAVAGPRMARGRKSDLGESPF